MQRWEEIERSVLAGYAVKAAESAGRAREEDPCPLRTCFQRDIDRITHTKAFRRLKYKTQCFLAPEGDHYRTRLTHTMEVSRIARTLARVLRVNEDLTEAIALGHDLGHTAFGHAGEAALDAVNPGGFRHREQSLRVVDVFENRNLTWEVRDGILHHSGDKPAATWEGRIVALADRIAYLNHDLDDALRAGIFMQRHLPPEVRALGNTTAQRIDALVHDAAAHTLEAGELGMSPERAEAMAVFRAFMFDELYRHPVAKAEEGKAQEMLLQLFDYYMGHIDELPAEFAERLGSDGFPRMVCDYIAGMTDRYAVTCYHRLFVPSGWQGMV
jgi:dGTPase